MNSEMLTKEDVISRLSEVKAYQAPVFGADDIQIPNYSAIRVAKGDKPLAILGHRYNLLNHVTAAEGLFEELDENVLNYDIRNLVMNDEKRMLLTIGFPEMEFDIDGSPIVPTMTLSNSVDGTLKFSKIFGYMRMVCTNGMMIGEMLFSQRAKHSVHFNVEKLNFDKIGDHMESFKYLIDKSRTVRVSEEFKKSLISSGFPARVIGNWNVLFEKYSGLHNETIKGNNVWAIQAVLTNWLTNVVAKTNIERSNTLSMALNRRMTEYVMK